MSLRVLLSVAILAGLISSLVSDEVLDALELPEGETLCPVQDKGAVGDGKTNDRKAIQAAIDQCGAYEGGGVVIFEKGKRYFTGALKMPSKTTLRLPEGTELVASYKVEDYPASPGEWFLIFINKATKVSLEGPGKIVGQAEQWTQRLSKETVLKNWPGQSCPDGICRPSLIGIRESSQIKAEVSLDQVRGVVVDGSKRVFVGQTDITTSGSSISAVTTTSGRPLESLLVDDVMLRSGSGAFQVGPAVKAEIKTIVAQNARVSGSRRGLTVQLQDSEDIHDIWFTNVTVETQHNDGLGHGAAECIHVSSKNGIFSSSIGTLRNIWFGNISCTSEGGFVFSGTPNAPIDSITVKDSSLELRKSTSLGGSFRDFRPSQEGLVNATSVPAIFLDNVNHVILAGLEVVLSSPPRKEWSGLFEMTPHSVHALQLADVHMHDEAAHASVPFVSPMKTMSQLSDFFKHSIREWANTIGHKGFISLQENAALGVSGRRAPSSGSPLIMAVLLVVLLAILIRYCCFPALRQRGKRKGNVLG